MIVLDYFQWLAVLDCYFITEKKVNASEILETQTGTAQTSKKESFVTVVNGYAAVLSIVDIYRGPG